MKKIVTVIFIFLSGLCYGQEVDSTWTKEIAPDGFKITISLRVIDDQHGYRVIFAPSRHIPVSNPYYNVYFPVFRKIHDKESALEVIRKIEANEFKINDEKS
jgi:hypothetical protein